MAEHPIIFSGPMVRAILEGRKTQTRRLVRWPAWADPERDWPELVKSGGLALYKDGRPIKRLTCPYGVPGDRLWVRETWQVDAPRDGSWCDTVFYGDRLSPLEWIPETYRNPKHCLYRASWSADGLWWRPSIHMPRWASRLTLEVVEVRVQRLANISENDCIAEGVDADSDDWQEGEAMQSASSLGPWRYAFAAGWDRINGKRGPWASNPWVRAITFTRTR